MCFFLIFHFFRVIRLLDEVFQGQMNNLQNYLKFFVFRGQRVKSEVRFLKLSKRRNEIRKVHFQNITCRVSKAA